MDVMHTWRSGPLLVAMAASFFMPAADRGDDDPEPGVGACELVEDRTCLELTPAQCEVAGGVFHGGPCEVPGACCIDGVCTMLNVYVCRSLGGTYMGHGVQCILVICPDPPAPCPCDFDGDGAVDFNDLRSFIGCYSSQCDQADFNGDGQVTQEDLDAFLECWETGCA